MGTWIKNLFVAIFGTNSWLATLIISMIPIVELRGAIPFGAAKSFWGENALELWQSFLISLAGSTLVCLILTFAFWPLFNWLKKTRGFKKLATFIENKLSRKSKEIENQNEQNPEISQKQEKKSFRAKIFGTFLFVAFPLPLTGVWMGTCLGLFLGLNRKVTFFVVAIANTIAGILMTLISLFFAENTIVVLLAFLILVVVFVLIEVIKAVIRKHKIAEVKE